MRRTLAPFWYVRTSNMPWASSGEPTGYSTGRVEWSASVAMARSRSIPKETQRCQSGRKASTQRSSINVAKASFNQMPFHHFIVTRSPNHMWAISWETTSAIRSSSRRDAALRIDQEEGFAEGDAPQVLHGPEGEVGDGEEVELLGGVGDAEPIGKEAQGVSGSLQGERRQIFLARYVDDPDRRAVDVDRWGGLEVSDDEGHEVGRHHHRVGEQDPSSPAGQR